MCKDGFRHLIDHWPCRVLLVLFLTLVGCGPPPTFRIETVVQSDGSCDRSIYQPKKDFLPPNALTLAWNAKWQTVSGAPCPPAESKLGLPLEGYPYFIARGSFKSPENIPSHYRYVNEKFPEAGASEIRRTYQQIDYGFVYQHRWEETITNLVTLQGFVAARGELLDMLIPIVVGTIEKELGETYDVSELVAYVRTDGKRFVEEIALTLYETMAQNLSEADLVERLADVAARYGINLRDDDANLVAHEEAERRTNDFFKRLLTERIRHRDGKALTKSEVDVLLSRALDEKVWEDQMKPVEERLGPVFHQMVGLYNPLAFLFQGVPHYQFVLKLPGQLIETNGKLKTINRVSWKFTGNDLYPSGYAMRASSVELDIEGQKRLLGHVAIGDSAKAIEFIDLLGDHGPLLEAVQLMKKTGKREGLDGLRTRQARKVREMLSAK